jgi:hypothetical protein
MNVYWSCFDDGWLRSKIPEKVSGLYFKSERSDVNNKKLNLEYCPAFKNNLKNVFAIRSIYDYSFSIIDNEVVSEMQDQDFFDKHVLIRSIEKKSFSFMTNYLFFTDEKSLEMTAYEYPFFEENNITNACIPIPGKFDIGKWMRPIEFPFYLKNNVNEFKVENEEIMFYLRFHTNEKINFKQFRTTELMKSFVKENISTPIGLTRGVSRSNGMEAFYKVMKTKKLILKEIKENLI